MSAYRGAVEQELGALIEDARPRRVPPILLAVVLVIGVLIDLGALLSPPRSIEAGMVLLMFGVVVPAIVILMLFARKPDRLRIHELGFRVGDGPAVRWDEVVELRTKRMVVSRNGQHRSVLDQHLIRLTNGQTLDLRCGFANNDAVLDHVRKRTRERLLRSTLLPATFGPITVDESGVRAEFATLTWSQIARAGFDGPLGHVVVRGPGSAWIEARIDEVPNAHVLCAIVNERAAAGLDAQ